MAKWTATEVLKLQQVQDTRQERLLGLQNVVGVGLATKVTGGQDTGQPCLSVFVQQKLPKDMLQEEDVIEPAVDGTPTDVIETGVIFAGAAGTALAEVPIEALTQRIRPAMGGFSVAHRAVTAGTYATAVIDASAVPGIPARYYILSNNHVLANSNNANPGDPILQPGPADGGSPADTIARLTRFVPIRFGGQPNYVDAAVAEGPFNLLSREIYWIGYVTGAAAAQIGILVQKTGRTTNYTTGTVRAINATVNVNYGGGQVARFVRQIVTTGMSAPGDSGSLLLDMERRAVGLLFAGSSTVTIFNDIRYVQHLLGIRIA